MPLVTFAASTQIMLGSLSKNLDKNPFTPTTYINPFSKALSTKTVTTDVTS